eukprot:g9654.t1
MIYKGTFSKNIRILWNTFVASCARKNTKENQTFTSTLRRNIKLMNRSRNSLKNSPAFSKLSALKGKISLFIRIPTNYYVHTKKINFKEYTVHRFDINNVSLETCHYDCGAIFVRGESGTTKCCMEGRNKDFWPRLPSIMDLPPAVRAVFTLNNFNDVTISASP